MPKELIITEPARGETTIYVGETFQFKAVVKDEEGANRTGIKIKWKIHLATNDVDGLAGSIEPDTGKYTGKYADKSDIVIAYAPDYPALPQKTAKINVKAKPEMKESPLPLILASAGGGGGFIAAIIVLWYLLRRRKVAAETAPLPIPLMEPESAPSRVHVVRPSHVGMQKSLALGTEKVRAGAGARAETGIRELPPMAAAPPPPPPPPPPSLPEKRPEPVTAVAPPAPAELPPMPKPPEAPVAAPALEKKPEPAVAAPSPPPEVKPSVKLAPKRKPRCRACGKLLAELEALKCECAALYHRLCAEKLEKCKSCGKELKK